MRCEAFNGITDELFEAQKDEDDEEEDDGVLTIHPVHSIVNRRILTKLTKGDTWQLSIDQKCYKIHVKGIFIMKFSVTTPYHKREKVTHTTFVVSNMCTTVIKFSNHTCL